MTKKQNGGYPNFMNNYQTDSQISEFGYLPQNNWFSSLGKNAGLVAQQDADTPGYYYVPKFADYGPVYYHGGLRNKKKTSLKKKGSKKKTSLKKKRNKRH